MSLLGSNRDSCPCGTGDGFTACCGPYLRGTARPPTAEALMRSRYTAFARGDTDHLWRTWHPRTRPDDVSVDPSTRWTGLTITDTSAGLEGDETGEVAFEARFEDADGQGLVTERSRFARRGGRWVYVDGDTAHG